VTYRLFYAADLHGSERCYRKFLNAAKFYGANALVIGGDLTGKVLIPIVTHPDGTSTSEWSGRRRLSAADVTELENVLMNQGLYSVRVSEGELGELNDHRERVDALFNARMQERLRGWLRLAEERLRPAGIPIYVIAGNDDRFQMDPVMRESSYVTFCEGEVVDVAGHEMVSCGFTNPTPWHTPRELAEEALETRLEALARRVARPERAIFNLHCPPFGTHLDLAPRLTPDLKYVAKGGSVLVDHVGARAVRNVLERHRPMLSLHGHIHESRAGERVGPTLALNPGSQYSEGSLCGVLVDLEDGAVARHQFTTG
jgi:Icc-related predicted phosphoesterase